MQLSFFATGLAAIATLFSSCVQTDSKPESKSFQQKSKSSIQYAKHFDMRELEDGCMITFFGKKNSADTTAVYILYDSIPFTEKYQTPTFAIKTPCRRIAALSSIYSAMLAELGALQQLIAIDNIDYINQKEVLEKHRSGNLPELSKGSELDLEKTIEVKPDLVVMFGMGSPGEELPAQLLKGGIPVALIVDHLEETPLARAEWIKLVGAFAGKRKEADSLFLQVEANYHSLQDSASQWKVKPKVLSELKYGDTWFVPGGKSFMSGFISDAGGQYAWKEDKSKGSLPLSFEEVYRRAGDAEVWINLSMVQSKKEMLAQEERYQKFKAYQDNRLYNNNKRVNSKGYSDYWETAMFHPDRVLRDLICIFHGDSIQEKDLYYYRKIR